MPLESNTCKANLKIKDYFSPLFKNLAQDAQRAAAFQQHHKYQEIENF